MKIEEPFKCFVNKTKPFAFFKLQDGKCLLFNGIQIAETNDKIYEECIVIKEKDVIPFILVHNMRIDATINILENNNKYGRGQSLLNLVKDARIENELNTNITVDDVYKEYDDGIITYDELYLYLIIDSQRKYRRD